MTLYSSVELYQTENTILKEVALNCLLKTICHTLTWQ